MNDNDKLDVLIAVYLIPDLAQTGLRRIHNTCKRRRDRHRRHCACEQGRRWGGNRPGDGDHLGRKGLTAGAGVGLVIGLFAPPLLAAGVAGAALGGLAGKFARHRLQSGIGTKLDDALPPGTAGVIAIYEHEGADAVARTLGNAIRTSVAQIDKASAKELKAGLEEASAGLAG